MARRISLVVIIVAISLGSGHLVQTRSAPAQPTQSASMAGDNG